MKLLIAVVMFLFGVFVGVLVMPTFTEFSTPLYLEEEYSTPRIKSLLHEFGITLPLEAADINVFFKQNGETKQLWVKFVCSSDVRDVFIADMTSKHSGMFNREIESPKMSDGSMVTWWSYRNTFRYYEFNGMCVAYDDVLQNVYIYGYSDGGRRELSPAPETKE